MKYGKNGSSHGSGFGDQAGPDYKAPGSMSKVAKGSGKLSGGKGPSAKRKGHNPHSRMSQKGSGTRTGKGGY